MPWSEMLLLPAPNVLLTGMLSDGTRIIRYQARVQINLPVMPLQVSYALAHLWAKRTGKGGLYPSHKPIGPQFLETQEANAYAARFCERFNRLFGHLTTVKLMAQACAYRSVDALA